MCEEAGVFAFRAIVVFAPWNTELDYGDFKTLRVFGIAPFLTKVLLEDLC